MTTSTSTPKKRVYFICRRDMRNATPLRYAMSDSAATAHIDVAFAIARKIYGPRRGTIRNLKRVESPTNNNTAMYQVWVGQSTRSGGVENITRINFAICANDTSAAIAAALQSLESLQS